MMARDTKAQYSSSHLLLSATSVPETFIETSKPSLFNIIFGVQTAAAIGIL